MPPPERIVWRTDEPVLDRDVVLALFADDLRCEPSWIDKGRGVFSNGNGHVFRVRIAWALESTWEVVAEPEHDA